MSGCGTRIVLRGQKPLALCDRCPCFGSLFPPLAALTFAASSIICAFGLAAAAPRSPYRHLELCGIALRRFSSCFGFQYLQRSGTVKTVPYKSAFSICDFPSRSLRRGAFYMRPCSLRQVPRADMESAPTFPFANRSAVFSLPPSGREVAPQGRRERTSTVPEAFRITARFSPPPPAGGAPSQRGPSLLASLCEGGAPKGRRERTLS